VLRHAPRRDATRSQSTRISASTAAAFLDLGLRGHRVTQSGIGGTTSEHAAFSCVVRGCRCCCFGGGSSEKGAGEGCVLRVLRVLCVCVCVCVRMCVCAAAKSFLLSQKGPKLKCNNRFSVLNCFSCNDSPSTVIVIDSDRVGLGASSRLQLQNRRLV